MTSRSLQMLGLVVALPLAACGGKEKNNDAGPKDGGIDAPPDAAAACANPVRGTNVTFREVGDVEAAMLATSPPGDPRLFVVEQPGAIRIFDENEQLLSAPFLDLSADAGGPVAAGGELGLLGLAFHPQYATNRTFFVFYTRQQPDDPVHRFRDVLARCQTSASDPNTADPASCVEVLAIEDFASNHNGGMIEFGSDGLLYIGTGDGGGGGDPNSNGQSLTDGSPLPSSRALLGKMLRINVDNKAAGKEYGIPADNPFAAGGGAPEIFQLGLRNPWRWSFDRATGDMWIADVGQGLLEEVNFVPAAEVKGKNFGWKMWEASSCFQEPCSMMGMFFPQDERAQSDGWKAIIGGQVYRGGCYPDLVGTYFYADNSSSQYAKATVSGGTPTFTDLTAAGFPSRPVSLHADGRGELWLTTLSGGVYRLEATP